MAPLLAALSSFLLASRVSTAAFSKSPASTASRALRMAVFREDLTDLLRCRAFSLVLMRLIWDLMFATKEPQSDWLEQNDCSGYQRRGASPKPGTAAP